jgi:hypothetical protein
MTKNEFVKLVLDELEYVSGDDVVACDVTIVTDECEVLNFTFKEEN